MKTKLIALGWLSSLLVSAAGFAVAAEAAPAPKNGKPPAVDLGDITSPSPKNEKKPSGGYIQLDHDATVTLKLLSYKGVELATFPLTVSAGKKIGSINELIPDPAFQIPRRVFGTTRVLRDGIVVAETKRVALTWPDTGDVVEVRELLL